MSRVVPVLRAMGSEQELFGLTLCWTGARVSEVLAITPQDCQIERAVIAVATLKRRASFVREVPIPPALMAGLNRCFGLSAAQRDPLSCRARLWPWSRVKAWRIIKQVMTEAGVHGPQACPRGMRHAFGVGTLQAGVPLPLTQRWMGHADIATTAIYAEACGPEEIQFARQFWGGSSLSERPYAARVAQ